MKELRNTRLYYDGRCSLFFFFEVEVELTECTFVSGVQHSDWISYAVLTESVATAVTIQHDYTTINSIP